MLHLVIEIDPLETTIALVLVLLQACLLMHPVNFFARLLLIPFRGMMVIRSTLLVTRITLDILKILDIHQILVIRQILTGDGVPTVGTEDTSSMTARSCIPNDVSTAPHMATMLYHYPIRFRSSEQLSHKLWRTNRALLLKKSLGIPFGNIGIRP